MEKPNKAMAVNITEKAVSLPVPKRLISLSAFSEDTIVRQQMMVDIVEALVKDT